jgi:hypothetical protein
MEITENFLIKFFPVPRFLTFPHPHPRPHPRLLVFPHPRTFPIPIVHPHPHPRLFEIPVPVTALDLSDRTSAVLVDEIGGATERTRRHQIDRQVGLPVVRRPCGLLHSLQITKFS